MRPEPIPDFLDTFINMSNTSNSFEASVHNTNIIMFSSRHLYNGEPPSANNL